MTLAQALVALEFLPQMFASAEPIGPVTEAAKLKLDSAIKQSHSSFMGYYPYRFKHQRAAALFYFIIKDHAFENGNKRTAVVLTVVFLIINRKMPTMSADSMYDIACIIAESEANEKNIHIKALSKMFKLNTDNIKV